jgi:hypothetical protein
MKGDVCYKAMNSSILWLIFTELYHVNFDVLRDSAPVSLAHSQHPDAHRSRHIIVI